MMRPSWIAAGASVLAVLCGCAASPKADFYTLSPAVVPVDTPPAGPIAVLITGSCIGIFPVPMRSGLPEQPGRRPS